MRGVKIFKSSSNTAQPGYGECAFNAWFWKRSEQGGVASQEDLAQVLNVSVRTIKRDCLVLQNEGIYLPTRGNLHGIGRGQTHKAQIIRHWLQGWTYDQIVWHTHHTATAIKRYIQAFVRVIELHQQGFSQNQIGLLLQMDLALVQEYLAVYGQNDSPECRERLQEQLKRLSGPTTAQKGGYEQPSLCWHDQTQL